MKTTTMALALACAAAALCSQARADEVYTYVGEPTITNPALDQRPPSPLDITLDISDAAVQAGSFSLATLGPQGMGQTPTYTGDLADFVSLSASSLNGTFTPSSGNENFQVFQIALTFDPTTDAVTSSSFVSHSEADGDASISGTGSTASGTFGSDDPAFLACSPQQTCQVSGSWTASAAPVPTPEPATFAMLGAGVIGLGLARRRRAASPV